MTLAAAIHEALARLERGQGWALTAEKWFELEEFWEARLQALIDELPHGSGIDSAWNCGLTADGQGFWLDNMFHKKGYYVGWVPFKVTVWPCFEEPGFRLTIRGQFSAFDAADLADYLAESIQWALEQSAPLRDWERERAILTSSAAE